MHLKYLGNFEWWSHIQYCTKISPPSNIQLHTMTSDLYLSRHIWSVIDLAMVTLTRQGQIDRATIIETHDNLSIM